MTEISTYLESHGVKPSVQRIALMEYLLTHRTHPTVDEMYSALISKIPTLSKTTVYNTMKLFVDNNLALSIAIDDKNLRFDGDVSVHAHFLCLNCGKLYDLPVDDSEKLKLESVEGKSVKEVMLYYKGYCENCIQK